MSGMPHQEDMFHDPAYMNRMMTIRTDISIELCRGNTSRRSHRLLGLHKNILFYFPFLFTIQHGDNKECNIYDMYNKNFSSLISFAHSMHLMSTITSVPASLIVFSSLLPCISISFLHTFSWSSFNVFLLFNLPSVYSCLSHPLPCFIL